MTLPYMKIENLMLFLALLLFAATNSLIAAITGIVEAPAFNGDETALYYHRKTNESDPDDVYKIYRVTRQL